MPYELDLPPAWKSQRWKVKIRDRERLEPPHVTILHKTREWRLGLRDGEFLVPPGGSWRDIPDEVRNAIRAAWGELQAEWNRMYPGNPVAGVEEGETDANDRGR